MNKISLIVPFFFFRIKMILFRATLKKEMEWAKYIEQVIQFSIAFLFHNPAIKGNLYVAQGHVFDF